MPEQGAGTGLASEGATPRRIALRFPASRPSWTTSIAGATACGAWLLATLLGCGGGTNLLGDRDAGDGTPDAGDGTPDVGDGTPDVGDGVPHDGADGADAGDAPDGTTDGETEGDSSIDDGGSDDTSADAEAPCPVWAASVVPDDREDGSAAHPYHGLQRAIDNRGSCDHIIIDFSAAETPLDAAVDIILEAGRELTIEGLSGGPLAQLDAHGDIGLYAIGGGSLVLRHLRVSYGFAPTGGCLHAELHSLRLEDTEWVECGAVEECSAVDVRADEIVVSDSRFLRNDVSADPTSYFEVGALCTTGPPDTASILVERCRFEDNHADWGAALHQRARTRDAVVRDSVFLRNSSREGPTALSGILGELAHNRFEANELEIEGAIVGVDGTPETRIVHNLFLENRCGRGAIALTASRGLVANNLFVGNTCRNAPESAWCTAAVWIPAGSAASIDLRNNTFIDNASEGGIVHLSYDSVFGRVRSNLFVGGTGRAAVGTDYPDWGVSAEMFYNAWWDVPEPVWGEGVRLGDGNLEADPRFVVDGYRLGAGSAAIDAGDPDPLLADSDGSRNDVGAFGGPEGDWTPLPEGGAP